MSESALQQGAGAARFRTPQGAEKLSTIDLETVPSDRRASSTSTRPCSGRWIDDSWEITTPKLRQGLTRKQWDSGNIPVTPFPAEAVQQIKYALDWSGQDLVYLKVAGSSRRTGRTWQVRRSTSGLARDAHSGPDRMVGRLLVRPGSISPSKAQRTAAAKTAVAPPASESLPQGLILIPVGILGILLIVGLRRAVRPELRAFPARLARVPPPQRLTRRRPDRYSPTMARKIRVVIAKPGLDGHDRGAKIIARASATPAWR